MKLLVWGIVALLALFWTGLAMLSISIGDWAFSMLGQSDELAKHVVTLPVWVQPWVNPEFLSGLQATLVSWIEFLSQILPSGPTLGWIFSALVWVVWGIGMAVLLMFAVAGHVLFKTRRFG